MLSWPADRVERRPLGSLIPYARNARTHTPAQVAQIAASMKEWGWTNPVLIDENAQILTGHGRILAADVLGLRDVPVMIAEGWSEAQKRAYVIADNKLALNAGWDAELLGVELSDLVASGFDAELTGFTGDELQALLADKTEGLTDSDAVPDVEDEIVSRICQDSRQPWSAIGSAGRFAPPWRGGGGCGVRGADRTGLASVASGRRRTTAGSAAGPAASSPTVPGG